MPLGLDPGDQSWGSDSFMLLGLNPEQCARGLLPFRVIQMEDTQNRLMLMGPDPEYAPSLDPILSLTALFKGTFPLPFLSYSK